MGGHPRAVRRRAGHRQPGLVACQRARATATASSEERFRRAFDAAPVAMALVSPPASCSRPTTSCASASGTRRRGRFWDFVPVADRAALAASWPPESDGPELERRYVRADGSLGWFIWRHSLIRDADG